MDKYSSYNKMLDEIEQSLRNDQQMGKINMGQNFSVPPFMTQQQQQQPFVQSQFTNNYGNTFPNNQQQHFNNFKSNFPPNNSTKYSNFENCGFSIGKQNRNRWMVESLDFQVDNDFIELNINLTNSKYGKKENVKAKATIDAIKFIENLLVDDTNNLNLEKQNFEEKIKNLEKQINEMKNKNCEENIAMKFLNMHNDHINEVKTLKEEIKQKLEENLSLKDELNAIIRRVNLLEQENTENTLEENKQNNEIKKEHLEYLTNYYVQDPYPNPKAKSIISTKTGVSTDKVGEWFKERRYQDKIISSYNQKIRKEQENKINEKDEQMEEEQNNINKKDDSNSEISEIVFLGEENEE